MKNYRTPRTLSESQFTTGYAEIEHAHHKHHRIADWVIALMLAGTVALVSWGIV